LIVLVCNLGTPEAPTPAAVRAFLAEFLGDPLVVDWPRWLWLPVLHGIILRSRPRKTAALYRSIWAEGGSPLSAGTERIAAALQAEVGDAATVRAVYRYGEPSLSAALQLADESGAERIRVLPLFPQRTGSSSGTIAKLVTDRAPRGDCAVVEVPADDGGYIDGLAQRVSTACDLGRGTHLVASFHGIPERYDRAEGGRYRRDCDATTAALRAALDLEPGQVTLAYQSKFGPERWLQPATADVLQSLPARGVKDVAVVTPGFLTEGLETLEEIGIRGRDSFLAAGGEHFTLVPAIESHPSLIRTLAHLVRDGGGTVPEPSPECPQNGV